MASDDVGECISELADVLRFFVELRNYSYVDRIANALTSEPVQISLRDALRHLRSFYDSSFEIKADEKKLRAVMVRIGGVEKQKVLPKIPKERCINEFLEAIRKDISVANRLAMMALSYRR